MHILRTRIENEFEIISVLKLTDNPYKRIPVLRRP